MLLQSKTAALLLVLVGVGSARAQLSVTNESAQVTTSEPKAETNSWSFSASLYTYIVPESREYVQPTVTADYGMLHLEGRYNYEALDTGSMWIGCNFGAGEKFAWEFSPMLGVVFGSTTGIAPGYKGALSWWKLGLYSEGEFLVDAHNSDHNFFYNWSELTLSPVDWFKVGMVTQRTRLYHTDRDIQRGFLVGLTFKHVDLTTYVLNPDESKPTVVLAASFRF